MKQFQNILVGVDPSQSDPPGSDKFSPPAQEAVEAALWLAEKTKAALTFFSAIDAPQDSAYLDLIFDKPRDLLRSLTASVQRQLDRLVERAGAKGVSAKAVVAQGVAWTETIRQVQENQHDLAIVGTRNLGGVERFLFGSTAQKLLRSCPCAVWVTRPEHAIDVSNILVTSDLQPVSQKALEAALALAPLLGAKVHFLHAIALERIWLGIVDERQLEMYEQRVHAEARKRLEEQVAGLSATGTEIAIEVVEGDLGADLAIVRYIDEHQIDTLVMGTAGRGGLPGLLVGNTAERMLHEAQCSLLAVKPDGFRAPLPPELPGGKKTGPYL